MKKTLLIIGLCIVLLSMPTILAFPTTNKPTPLFNPNKMSDGTFVGGLGRGHWGNGFQIDSIYNYIYGVYYSGPFTRILGEITNLENEKMGEISVYMLSTIFFGYTRDLQGQQGIIIGFVMEHKSNHFVGRIFFCNFKPAPHIWANLIPNK